MKPRFSLRCGPGCARGACATETGAHAPLASASEKAWTRGSFVPERRAMRVAVTAPLGKSSSRSSAGRIVPSEPISTEIRRLGICAPFGRSTRSNPAMASLRRFRAWSLACSLCLGRAFLWLWSRFGRGHRRRCMRGRHIFSGRSAFHARDSVRTVDLSAYGAFYRLAQIGLCWSETHDRTLLFQKGRRMGAPSLCSVVFSIALSQAGCLRGRCPFLWC